VLDRRVGVLEAEGITFETGYDIGLDITAEQLRERFDAVVLCVGADRPRDIDVPGRDLNGIHVAMDYLVQQNRRVAGERALARLGARKLTTRKAPVAFSSDLARGLFGHFIGAISGPSQYRKSSFLLNAAGEQVFPAFLQMQERPHIMKGLASSPFDQEGAATRDRELVSNGVVGGYVLGSYSARRLGLKTTGNAGGLHNLLVSSRDGGLEWEAFLKRLGTGMLVTELMGQGVNGVTGDYSRGASGFWVENGALAYPVHEITIAGNLKPMYRDVVALGADVDTRGGIRVGSVLLSEMTIAGE
jgi:PmbA protein